MKLKIGKMTTKELAQWFGISYGSFRVYKDTKLKELEDYAEFDIIYGGVIITKIKDENMLEYVKTHSKSKEIIYNAFDEEWSAEGIDTCSNVALKIYDKHKNELSIAETTAYSYTIAARNELYGRPFVDMGKLGSCRYLWVKVTGEENGVKTLEVFTDEEDKIKKNLMKKYFSTDEEKELMVAEMVERGEITKAEAYDALCEMKNLNAAGFMAFKKELEKAIGLPVLKGTLIEKKAQLENRGFNWTDAASS